MRIIKSLAPILILIILSVYGLKNYANIPDSIINGLIFLPHLLALLVVGLALHFNRRTIFLYTTLIAIGYLALKFNWASNSLRYTLLSCFLLSMLVILTPLPERGILNSKSIPAYATLLIGAWVCITLTIDPPQWADKFFLTDWLPIKYFDWTHLSQLVIAFSFISIISLLLIFSVRPSTNTATGFGVAIMLILQLHNGTTDQSLLIFSSSALLMCLYGIMQESWRMAYLDELTGLPARRALREKFQNLNGEYAIAMLDVDHFKKFNDTYGHDTGDSVLRMIAGKLEKVAGGGISYRYGGEEFTIVFLSKNIIQAKEHLEILRESIANSAFIVNRDNRRSKTTKTKIEKKKTVQITVSIGVSDSTKNASAPWDVLKLADKALYRAKKKGRNCTVG